MLPGLGGANGAAILLPLTFSMDPPSAIIMPSCIYRGGAVRRRHHLDPVQHPRRAVERGHHLRRLSDDAAGPRPAQALTAAYTSSFVGAVLAVILITFTAPLLASFALEFGPAEFFAVQRLTFCSFVGMSKEPPAKTIAATMLGFALAAVGMDTVTGQLRMTYGHTELLKGFGFLIAVIGLFGIGEILLTMEEGLAPGSPTAAVLLGGLLIWGLQPGPMLFVEQKDFVWGLIASMYIGNIVGLIVVLTTVPWWAAILRFLFSIIGPVIIVICAIGAYTVNNSMFDVVMMMVFGVMGYLFKKLKYPLAPMALALVLGDMAESSFRQAMLMSQGSMSIFWGNPLVAGITGLAVAMLVWPLWGAAMNMARRSEVRASA